MADSFCQLATFLWCHFFIKTFNILNVFITFQSIPFWLLNLVFCLERPSSPMIIKILFCDSRHKLVCLSYVLSVLFPARADWCKDSHTWPTLWQPDSLSGFWNPERSRDFLRVPGTPEHRLLCPRVGSLPYVLILPASSVSTQLMILLLYLI